MNYPSKNEIRKSLQTQRKQLTKSAQKERSDKLVNIIKESDIFKQARDIAFYHAVQGEADPSKLMSSNNIESKQFYLPIISSNKNQGLVFAPINQSTQYKNNQFSIPEPVVDTSEWVDARTLDLVIMPLLGFDLAGNRLGMGGGYYDRCFAFKKQQTNKPILIGFAYDFQQVDKLNAESWDIGLDMIATESQLIHF